MADSYCINSACAKQLFGPVQYCPYCGQPQRAAQAEPAQPVQRDEPVQPAPSASLVVEPAAVEIGHSAALRWTSANATQALLDRRPVALSGSLALTPQVSGRHDYVLEVRGPGGSASASASLQVSAPQALPPSGMLELEPGAIELGRSSQLSWHSEHAESALLNGDHVAREGSLTLTPTEAGRFTYELMLTGAGGIAVRKAILVVRPAAPAAPAPPPAAQQPRRKRALLALAGVTTLVVAYMVLRPDPTPTAPPPPPSRPAPPSLDTKAAAAHVSRMLAATGSGNEAGINTARDALEKLAKPVRGDRRKARELNQRGLELMRAQQYEQAARMFEEGQAADPGDVEVADNVGYAYLKAGRLGKAEPALITALSLAPTRSQAWFSMAQVYSRSQRGDDAVAAFVLAQRYSGNPAKTLQFIQESAANDPEPGVRKAAARALERPELGRIAAAIERVSPSAPTVDGDKGPKPPPTPTAVPPPSKSSTAVLLGLGSTCLAKNQYDCAIDAATRALAESPNDAEARRLLGLATAAKQEARRRANEGLQ